MKRYKALSKSCPDYSAKANGLMSDPQKMVIQGPVCWTLGYPPLDHERDTKITPTQFQRVQTLRAGTGTGATSTRSDKNPSLKPVN
jgi:hypothetical protein